VTIAATGDGFFRCMCDDCEDLFEEDGNSFGHMIRIIMLSAWIAHRDSDDEDWKHRCTNCIQEGQQRPERGSLHGARRPGS